MSRPTGVFGLALAYLSSGTGQTLYDTDLEGCLR